MIFEKQDHPISRLNLNWINQDLIFLGPDSVLFYPFIMHFMIKNKPKFKVYFGYDVEVDDFDLHKMEFKLVAKNQEGINAIMRLYHKRTFDNFVSFEDILAARNDLLIYTVLYLSEESSYHKSDLDKHWEQRLTEFGFRVFVVDYFFLDILPDKTMVNKNIEFHFLHLDKEFREVQYFLPFAEIKAIDDPNQILIDQVYKAFYQYYGYTSSNDRSLALSRLSEEISLIIKENQAFSFILAKEIANQMKLQNLYVSTATLGSYLVSFLLGISDINPLAVDNTTMVCDHNFSFEYDELYFGFRVPKSLNKKQFLDNILRKYKCQSFELEGEDSSTFIIHPSTVVLSDITMDNDELPFNPDYHPNYFYYLSKIYPCFTFFEDDLYEKLYTINRYKLFDYNRNHPFSLKAILNLIENPRQGELKVIETIRNLDTPIASYERFVQLVGIYLYERRCWTAFGDYTKAEADEINYVDGIDNELERCECELTDLHTSLEDAYDTLLSHQLSDQEAVDVIKDYLNRKEFEEKYEDLFPEVHYLILLPPRSHIIEMVKLINLYATYVDHEFAEEVVVSTDDISEDIEEFFEDEFADEVVVSADNLFENIKELVDESPSS